MIRNAEGKAMSSSKESKYIPTEKRYLISTSKDSIYIDVFDRTEQRVIYTSNNPDKKLAFKHITRIYGSRNIEILESELKVNRITYFIKKKEMSFGVISETKITLDIEPEHIKKKRETFKWIDKYKHKLKPIFKYNEKYNILTIELINDTIAIDTHLIECNFKEGIYLYFFKGKQVEKRDNLEDIFKPKIK